MNSPRVYLGLAGGLILCLAAFYGGRALAIRPAEEKIAVLEKKQDKLSKQISDLDAMLEKRWQLLPMAKLWVTNDHVVCRTAIPEFYTSKLAWVVIRNGVEILQRSAGDEMKLEMFSGDQGRPGLYVIYLSTWIDGNYRPVSNVLAFQIPAKSGQMEAPPVPQNAPSATPSPNESGDINSRVRSLDRKISISAERVVEFLAYRDQQRTLPLALTLWMDQNHVIYRDVGPEEIEENLDWSIGGAASLGRNARGETTFRPWYTQGGHYTACLTIGSNTVSNTLEFGPAPDVDLDNADDDMDNDGMKNSNEAVINR